MPATGTYHSRTLFEARNGYDPRWLGLHRSGTAVPVLKAKNPAFAGFIVFRIRSLAVFYSHMGAENGFKQANCFACSVRSGFASGEDWGPPSGTDDREVELSVLLKRKKADLYGRPFSFQLGAWRCSTLTWGDPTLPSTLTCFTSEFGMDSGGTTSLLPPGINFL